MTADPAAPGSLVRVKRPSWLRRRLCRRCGKGRGWGFYCPRHAAYMESRLALVEAQIIEIQGPDGRPFRKSELAYMLALKGKILQLELEDAMAREDLEDE